MSSPLLTIPDKVKNRILNELDLKSIFILRKTCHDLRNHIDDVIPQKRLATFSIISKPDRIFVSLKFRNNLEYGIYYCNTPIGCTVELVGNSRKKISENFFAIFSKDVKNILKFLKSIIEIFHLDFEPKEPRILDEIQKIFEKIKTEQPLKIKKLSMNAYHQNHILSILPLLDSNILEEIHIFHPTSSENCLDLTEIVKTEQWKNAKKMDILSFLVSEPVQNFSHFLKANIFVTSFSMADFMVLKEKFLQTSNLEVFYLEYEKLTNPECFEILGSPFIFNYFNGKEEYWYFRIPGNDAKVLYTSHMSSMRHVLFFYGNVGLVPDGARIQD